MMTFVLSFLRTFSSAAEKNSALSPSLISPSIYRIVKLSVCFFSTINPGLRFETVQAESSKSVAWPQGQHAVHPPEAERIREEEAGMGLAGGVRDVVEIARRVGLAEVDRRRQKAAA